MAIDVLSSPLAALSRRTETFGESVIREMTRICDAAGGCNLAQGFPDFDPPDLVKQAAIDAINGGLNQYPVTFGEPALRDAIAAKISRHNGLRYDPESEITVTCGATEAMIATMIALVNPGDEVIIFEPFYENYGPDGILSGASPRYVRLRPPDWTFNEHELAAAFNPATKAIVVNTPNNPTGKLFSRQELTRIADLCCRHGCYAVTDEVYEHIVYDGAEHISLAALPGMRDRTITISSASKSYSVTGWRVGWAIASRSVTERIRKVHDFLTVGAPTPLQMAVAAALQLDGAYYDGLRAGYAAGRELMLRLLRESGFSGQSPSGAYYIFADASPVMRELGVNGDVELAHRLVELAGVATVPGSAFFSDPADGRSYLRFCFSKSRATLEAADRALRQALAGLQPA